jgi:ribosomal protein S19
MKKLILILLCAQIIASTGFSQIKKIITPEQQDLLRAMPTTTRPDWVSVYEQPGFAGREAKYAQSLTPFIYPFTNKRNISLKVAPDYIAYIKFNSEFQEEFLFTGDYPNFGTTYTNDILSIRVVPADVAYINLSGISFAIHNNDCRKVWGDIKIKVFERLPSGEMLLCPIRSENGSNRVNTHATTSIIYQNTSVDGFSPFYNLSNYLFNNARIRNVPVIRTWVTSSAPSIGCQFLGNSTAFREGRIFIEVDATNLRLGHKSGDLASDYSDNITIKANSKELINYTQAGTFFSTNAFLAKGNPNNSIEASGVEYRITKYVRVHLNKQPYRY